MAITRTPIIDDDGSMTVGTVFENAWKQELYDQIDGAIAALPPAGTITAPYKIAGQAALTLSGTVADWAPAGGTGKVVWGLTVSAGTILTGLTAEADGTLHLLINTSGNPLTIANQHAGSITANRFIGPGFADFSLGVWRSVWIYRLQSVNSWLVLVP